MTTSAVSAAPTAGSVDAPLPQSHAAQRPAAEVEIDQSGVGTEPAQRGRTARELQVSDFSELNRRVQEAGLLRRRYGYYWTKFAAMTLLGVGLVVVFVGLGDTWWQLGTAAILAVYLTQLAFLGHDAAHRQVFVSGRWNDWASIVVANLMVGLSYGWWQQKHTRHHANPNKEGADPDIGANALAFVPEVAASRRTPLTRWLVRRQGWLFFPLLLLEGLHLHVASVRRVLHGDIKRRGAEAAFLFIRLGSFVALVFAVLPPAKALAFLGVELAIFGLYMGSAFAPNHKGMPIVPPDVKIDFLRRQVLMSRNVTGGRWVDVAMGGLNYQIEHHLFPSMPRPALRRVKPIVQAYCAEVGVGYVEMSLLRSYRVVVQYLNRVGLGHRDPFVCPVVAHYRR
jgi:fatty acid desaturase